MFWNDINDYCPWNYLIFKDNGEECDGLHAYEVYLTNSEYMVKKSEVDGYSSFIVLSLL